MQRRDRRCRVVLRRLFGGGRQVQPPETLRAFSLDEHPLTQDGVSLEGDAWRIDAEGERTVNLFDLTPPPLGAGTVVYRASLRTADAHGVYLEMWCRFPGKGEFFSKGLHQVMKGTTEWTSREVLFRLKAGQQPDLVRLNLILTGGGTAWVKDVQLLHAAAAR